MITGIRHEYDAPDIGERQQFNGTNGRHMNKLILTSAICSAALLLSACDGGSGSSSNGTGDNTDNGGSNNTGDVVDTSSLAVKIQPVRGGVLVDFQTISGADTYWVYTSTGEISASSPSAGSDDFQCQESPCLVTGLDNGELLNLRVEAASGSSQLEISSQLAVVAGAINDTGEASCISITGNFPDGISNCDGLPAGADIWPKDVLSGAVALPTGRVPQQDGNTGRDANAQLVKVGSGIAGFDYTKLDANGNAVSASNTAFECVRDNVTGLVWQTNRPTSPAQDWQGVPRDYDAAASGSESYSRCGLTSGWRLPTKAEAESLLQYSRTGVSADTDFFTDLEDGWYWTSSSYPAALSGPDAGTGVKNDSVGSDFHNWVINFTTGQRSTFDRNGASAVSQSLTMYVNDTANP